jgi:hypothetical protein
VESVTARYFDGMKPEQIEWVWQVEAKRRATPEEIRKLCAGTRPEFSSLFLFSSDLF